MTLDDDLRALEAAATPGPWHVSEDDGRTVFLGYQGYQDEGTDWASVVCEGTIYDEGGHTKADAALIAAARNALPALLAIAEALPEDPWAWDGDECYSCHATFGPGLTLADAHNPSCRWLAANTALATLEDR